MRSALAGFLLIAGFALPLSAWAVDADGDGVDDSIDAFPTYPEATTDTDGDGKPDVLNNIIFQDSFEGSVAAGWTGVVASGHGWSVSSLQAHSGSQSLLGARSASHSPVAKLSRQVTIPAQGGTISYWHKKDYNSPYPSDFDGIANSLFTSTSWVPYTIALGAGVSTLTWTAGCNGTSGPWNYYCGYLDDVEVRSNSSLVEDADDDNDGVLDATDQCPLDPACIVDADGDGIDNALDTDDDNDGVLDGGDNCPVNSNADQLNTDGDVQGNVCDTDDDNDGVADSSDKFPLNIAASSDTDVDGFPGSWNALCNAACQSNSGLVLDNCPSNANVNQLNTDGDAQGDVCDTDDDNDGVADTSDKFPLDATEALDTDNDGIGNNADTDDDGDQVQDINDNCLINVNTDQLDTDGDAQGDICDGDDDNDGVVDATDKFPLDATETLDADNDGTGNNADPDDDNDTVLDGSDNCPLHVNADQQDDDNDGAGNPCDSDGPGKLDTSFNPGLGANNDVYSVVSQPDGKVLIGGLFTTVNGVIRNRIARMNSDGSLDTSFNPGTGANNDVYSVVSQPDGKVLIGGAFTMVNGVSRKSIARLNTDGSLDTGFNPGTGATGYIKSVVMQADGKVLIGGDFTNVNGVARNRIARLNADGSLDAAFNPSTGADGAVRTLALQADGKVLIGGYFTNVSGVPRNRIARLNSDGSLDTGFNPIVNVYPYSVVLSQPDGKVLIGGDFTTVNGVSRNGIARLNSDGSLDTGFSSGAGPNNYLSFVVLQADGKVLIGGAFTAVNGVPCNYIARLNSDGSFDTGFSSIISVNSASSVAFQADGKALIGGSFTSYNGTNINRIARIHTGDADQDGIEDAADYFSNNAAAALDTDRDGLPDAWLQPNGFGCVANANSCNGLTLDNDNDNDGVPDYIDADPFNAAINTEKLFLLNNNYQGSAMRESQAVQ